MLRSLALTSTTRPTDTEFGLHCNYQRPPEPITSFTVLITFLSMLLMGPESGYVCQTETHALPNLNTVKWICERIELNCYCNYGHYDKKTETENKIFFIPTVIFVEQLLVDCCPIECHIHKLQSILPLIWAPVNAHQIDHDSICVLQSKVSSSCHWNKSHQQHKQ
jgi:hypothetical protein